MATITKIVAALTDKDMYCFKCGDKAHIAKDCTVQDLKCDIHPNSKSQSKMACFIYRKANNLPVRTSCRKIDLMAPTLTRLPLPETVQTL